MGKIVDKTGRVYGKLTVTCLTAKRDGRHVVYECLCECGNIANVSTANLRDVGGCNSCGCGQLRQGGLQAKHKDLYDIWRLMLSRCHNRQSADYPSYGGRGIRVCRAWRDSFAAFVFDMAPRPAGKQLDRRDNDKGYSPGNCRWATPRQNSNNRRSNFCITYKGETLTTAQWSRRTGLRSDTIRGRLVRGWSVKKALTTEI